MTASYEQVEEWKTRGKDMGATHIISVCDTFDWDDYPVFVMPGEDAKAKEREYRGKEMARVNEVIKLV